MVSKKHTILIVEDEELMIKAITRKLEDADFEVMVAKDGEEGLKKAFDSHPDLILLDVALPVMDGITFLEKLRQDQWGKKAPVIVLSNLSKASTVAESKQKGVNTYLVKTDWKLSEVVQKVKYELGIL